jgi:hypothetical protein
VLNYSAKYSDPDVRLNGKKILQWSVGCEPRLAQRRWKIDPPAQIDARKFLLRTAVSTGPTAVEPVIGFEWFQVPARGDPAIRNSRLTTQWSYSTENA